MLDSLHIENVAVAKNLDFDMNSGFTVLTGQTGAGKSIVIDSINMLLGNRVSKDIIRTGENYALVSAVFTDLSDSAISHIASLDITPDEDGAVMVTRVVTAADGKSNVKINGRSVPLSLLKEIGSGLINIHGQNDNQVLMQKSNHIAILDEFAGCGELSAEYEVHYTQMKEIEARLDELISGKREAAMLTDILKYQIKEIDLAKLSSPDEEEKLTALRNKLKNLERISKNVGFIYKALFYNEKGNSASALIERSVTALNQLTDIIPEAADFADKLMGFKYDIDDIAERIQQISGVDELESGGIDPQKQLDNVESRLNMIGKLKMKYGSTVEEIIQFKNDAKKKLNDLDSSDILISEANAELDKCKSKASVIAASLSAKREEASVKLSADVSGVLAFLDMPKVKFKVVLRRLTDENGGDCYGPRGLDDVDFMISTNPGEPLQSLGKIVSGGELSRIMLALKSTISGKLGAQTLIFDEIDTGVSGKTSQKIGLKLRELSADTQILCVTHSAQIASLADTHCLIEKKEVDGRAEAFISELDTESRITEVARIIGGIDITQAQTDAAREMVTAGINYEIS
jgi:DNA repair protein RecN